ncbi:hypothetical protein FMN63_14770 [Stappia sp. BW2]|uniref:hypothetical protein n=1 Tax=Stappia sp. BW2 TaxID=2592622 RepID=UPI0011DEBB3C|nr:hypothetical protein [Stappia sp. BW2]TYC67339.1 hypothetical protein FMN63_14770 [Stappia sp. BW2]
MVLGSDENTNSQILAESNSSSWPNVKVFDDFPGDQARRLKPNVPDHLRVQGIRKLKETISKEIGAIRGNISSLTVGDIRELPALMVIEMLGEELVYLIDDGSVAPQVANNRNTFQHLNLQSDSANFRKKHFFELLKSANIRMNLLGPQRVCYQSIYEFNVPLNDYYEKIKPDLLDIKFQDLNIADETWIIGTNHLQTKITSPKCYEELLGVYKDRIDGLIKYFPHRKETGGHLNNLKSKWGFERVDWEGPIEDFIFTNMVRPQLVAGTASTVFDYLNWYSKGEQKTAIFKMPERYFTGKRRTHIEIIQKYHLNMIPDPIVITY